LKERKLKLEQNLTVDEILSKLIGADLTCKVISYQETVDILQDSVNSGEFPEERKRELNAQIQFLNIGQRISEMIIEAINENEIEVFDDDDFIKIHPFRVRVERDSFVAWLNNPSIKNIMIDRLSVPRQLNVYRLS
jgi:hypothetical protein